MSIIDRVLTIARGQVGVREIGGNNHGPQVKHYLAAVGLSEGQPWCAAYVAWAMQQAGVVGWPATGDTWAIRIWAKDHGVLRSAPSRGDVFLLLDAGGDPMHTGFVTDVVGDRIRTIEGNTGLVSDTDGDGVAAKSRPVSGSLYVRWADVLSTAPQPAPPDALETIEVWQHDGQITIKVGSELHPVVGVKSDDAPWGGSYLLIRYRPQLRP